MKHTRGQGGLFVWVFIVAAIFAYSFMFLIFDYIITNQIPIIANQLNDTTSQAMMNDTILPVWRISPWAFAFAVMLYGIFYSISHTPEGRY